MSRTLIRQLMAGILLTVLVSCGEQSGDIQIISEPSIRANPNKAVPLAALVTFKTNIPVTTILEISDGENQWEFNYDSTMHPENGLPLVGMRPDRDHTVTITLRDRHGTEIQLQEPLTYRTPLLPDGAAEFPSIEVPVRKPEQMEPGYTLLNPRRRVPRQTQVGTEEEREFGQNFGMLLMMDDQGIPVWYYRTDSRISDFDYLENGHIQYVAQDFRIVEIDLLGNVINSWYAANRPEGSRGQVSVETLTFHHDADRMPSGNILALSTEQRQLDNYYTSEYDEHAPRKPQNVMGDVIVEFDQAGQIVWTWNAFEHMDPYRIGYEMFIPYWIRRGFPETVDWSHANSLLYIPEDDAVLINFRLQSAILNLDHQTGKVQWVFGEPTGWPEGLQEKLIGLEGDARWFWHQHAPVYTSRGTLLLFDNGNYRARPFEQPTPIENTYSRAAEYEIDEETMTARQVWTSEVPGEERVLSIAMGSVSELPNTGNVLIGYGAILEGEDLDELTWETRARADQWTMTREVTHTDPPEIIWEMYLQKTGSDPSIGWNIFGVQRIRELKP